MSPWLPFGLLFSLLRMTCTQGNSSSLRHMQTQAHIWKGIDELMQGEVKCTCISPAAEVRDPGVIRVRAFALVCLGLQGTLLIRGPCQRPETPPGKTSATKFCGSKQFPAMTAWHKLSCHERGVPEVGFRLVRTNNQPNHGAVRS